MSTSGKQLLFWALEGKYVKGGSGHNVQFGTGSYQGIASAMPSKGNILNSFSRTRTPFTARRLKAADSICPWRQA
jgi:hypothetical protein